MVCLAPQLFLLVYPHVNMRLPGSPATAASFRLLADSLPHPLCPSCPSLPFLLIWVNVSSLTPWLSDFHTVQFSGSSGYFLFLIFLLSFWFCQEAKCIYLCLHLDCWGSRQVGTILAHSRAALGPGQEGSCRRGPQKRPHVQSGQRQNITGIQPTNERASAQRPLLGSCLLVMSAPGHISGKPPSEVARPALFSGITR